MSARLSKTDENRAETATDHTEITLYRAETDTDRIEIIPDRAEMATDRVGIHFCVVGSHFCPVGILIEMGGNHFRNRAIHIYAVKHKNKFANYQIIKYLAGIIHSIN